jgi:hypothetical protein
MAERGLTVGERAMVSNMNCGSSEKGHHMVDANYDFTSARIEADAVVPHNGSRINVFRTSSNRGQVLFEVDYKFAKNGNDFTVIISNFGIPNKFAAGSEGVQKKFNSVESNSARQRIEEYFYDSKEKKAFPFEMGRGRFLGIEFVDGWIDEGN